MQTLGSRTLNIKGRVPVTVLCSGQGPSQGSADADACGAEWKSGAMVDTDHSQVQIPAVPAELPSQASPRGIFRCCFWWGSTDASPQLWPPSAEPLMPRRLRSLGAPRAATLSPPAPRHPGRSRPPPGRRGRSMAPGPIAQS